MSKLTIAGFENYGKCAVCDHWEGPRNYSRYQLSEGVTFNTEDEGHCACGGKLDSRFGYTRATDTCRKWTEIKG